MNQIKQARLGRPVHFYAIAILLLMLGFGGAPEPARGQWTTSGGSTTTADKVGIGTATPTTKLEVVGGTKTDSLSIGGAAAEKTFTVMWNNAVANQKVSVNWPANIQVDGIYEVTVTGHYWFSNSNGGIRKRIVINGRGDGIMNMQQSEVPFRLGFTGSRNTISDIKWDATNKRYYFVVANLDNAQNGITIHVKSITPLATPANADSLTMSPIYTTDATVFPQLFTSFMGSNVGIGTATPAYALDVNGEINATGLRINGTPISTSGGGTPSQWATSGANIYYNAGNVGIGTAAPANKLDVQGSAAFSGTTTVAGRGVFSLDGSNNLNLSALPNNLVVNTAAMLVNGGIESRDNYFGMRQTSNNVLTVRIPSAGSAYFNQGSVGINTTAPVGLLNVTGGGTNHYDASLQNVLVNAQQGTAGAGQTRHSVFGSVNLGHDNNTASGVYGHVTAGSGQNFSLGSMAGVRGYAAAPPNTTFDTSFRTYGGHFVGENPSAASNGNGHHLYGIYAKAGSSYGTASEVQFAGYFENGITAGNDAYGLYQATAGARNYFAGSVGIGTATPTTKLEVAGQIKSSSGGFVFPDGTVQTTAAAGGGSVAAGNVTAGQFGAGNYIFPGNVDVSGSVTWGNSNARTETKNNAGAIASRSGFFETASPANYPAGATSWWHLIESRHSNPANNYALQMAGSFFDQHVYVRKTNNNGATPWSKVIVQDSAGNASIGASPSSVLDVQGNINVSGNINAKYQDVAEWVESSQKLAAGTVVALDPERSNQVLASSEAYDTRVAGVISAQPGISLGERGEGKVLVATTGRVKVRVDASRGPIRIGDLLVTSDVPGVAMRSEPVAVGGRRMHLPGTLIGKALEPLEKGTGEILVLLSLQ